MSIVNLFFWVMLLLLGALTAWLVDSFTRAENIALAELDRINHITRHPDDSSVAMRHQRRQDHLHANGRAASDGRQPQLEKRHVDEHRSRIEHRYTASDRQSQACFFTVGVAPAADKRDEARFDAANDQAAAVFDFALPHAAGYDPTQYKKERTALADCPSCAKLLA